MPSDSVSSFLDRARAERLFSPDQMKDLFRQPEESKASLAELCNTLQKRGVLTPYQAELVRSGRRAELNFAGYPIADEIGPCPGGTAYKALHPSLRTPVVLRRLRPEWFAPADVADAFVARAQAASTVTHDNLAHLLDAGVYQGEPFVAVEPFDGADLETLIRDIGPMPAPLAAMYGRQIALALAAAHERGLSHGHVRPAVAWVGPLVAMAKPRSDGTPRARPAASASVKLFDLGLVPHQPIPAADATGPATDGVDYFPPERLDSTGFTPAGDVYGLGATLYFLLTGRPPFAGSTAGEVAVAVRDNAMPPLSAVRPDAPPALVKAIEDMMARDPTARPTAVAAAESLAGLAGPPSASAPTPNPPMRSIPPEPADVPLAVAAGPGPGADVDLSDLPTPDRSPVHVPQAAPYQPASVPYHLAPAYVPPQYAPHPVVADLTDESGDTPRRRRVEEPPSNRWVLWLIVGVFLQLLAVGLWFFYISGGTAPSPSEPDEPPKKVKKQPGKSKPRDAE